MLFLKQFISKKKSFFQTPHVCNITVIMCVSRLSSILYNSMNIGFKQLYLISIFFLVVPLSSVALLPLPPPHSSGAKRSRAEQSLCWHHHTNTVQSSCHSLGATEEADKPECVTGGIHVTLLNPPLLLSTNPIPLVILPDKDTESLRLVLETYNNVPFR